MTGDGDALADLIRDWGAFYVITAGGNLYHAERRDSGARVHEASPARLRSEIEQDHRRRSGRRSNVAR